MGSGRISLPGYAKQPLVVKQFPFLRSALEMYSLTWTWRTALFYPSQRWNSAAYTPSAVKLRLQLNDHLSASDLHFSYPCKLGHSGKPSLTFDSSSMCDFFSTHLLLLSLSHCGFSSNASNLNVNQPFFFSHGISLIIYAITIVTI